MDIKKASKIWIILAVVFGFLYILGIHSLFSDLAHKLHIPVLGRLFETIFLLMTICLFYYPYENPDILFSIRSRQRRALMTKNFWDDIKNIPDEKLSLLEEKMNSIIETI